MLEAVDDIDADWMRAVFAAQGIHAPDLHVVDIEPIGQGNLAEVVRVGLAAGAAAIPAAVVCKLGAAAAEKRGFAQMLSAYAREARCYEQVLSRQVCRAPLCYHVAVSNDGSHFNLVMEDLSGARAGDQAAGCSVAEARSALEQLAHLHRTHWNDSRFASADWLMRQDGESGQNFFVLGVEQFRQRYAEQIGPRNMSALERVAPRVAEWVAATTERNAFCHNDARVDNFMFLDHSDGSIEAVLLDWQMAGYRNPLADVAYFLTGSLDIEDRRSHERELLRMYFEQVREADSSLTFDQVLSDYRQQIISGLVATVGSSVVIPPGYRDAMFLALATRNCAAALDWGFV